MESGESGGVSYAKSIDTETLKNRQFKTRIRKKKRRSEHIKFKCRNLVCSSEKSRPENSWRMMLSGTSLTPEQARMSR